MLKFFIFFSILLSFNNASSQENLLTLKQQIDRLQREVTDLSKSVFTGVEDNLNNNSETNMSTFDLRIYDLEKDIKRLNENIEELVFQLDDLQNYMKS